MKIKEKNIPQNQQEKERVIKYLYKHPNLFNENPELLEFLSPPSLKKNNILDMQEFLIGSLQKNCQNLRSKNNFLVDLSKENLQNQEKIHNAILKILSTESFNDFIKKILIELPKILSIDQIFLDAESYEDPVEVKVETIQCADWQEYKKRQQEIMGRIDYYLGELKDHLL